MEKIQEKRIIDNNDEPSGDDIEEETEEIQNNKTDILEDERKEENNESLKDEAEMLNIRNILTVSKIGQKTAESEVKRFSLEIIPPQSTEEVSAEDETEESVSDFSPDLN